MSKVSTTQLSRRHLEDQGYLVAKVEHYNAFTRRRHDLFGLFDLLGGRRDETIAVQTTSASNVSARVKKIADHPDIGRIREFGWRLVVHGWVKRGRFWVVREVDCS